jgi:MFS family permease
LRLKLSKPKFSLGTFALLAGPVGLFVVAHFVHHLSTALHTPLMPQIREDLGIDYTKAGVLMSAFSIPYGIAQLPTGLLADRLGRRLVMSAGFVLMAGWAVAVGLSQTFWQLAIFLAFLGVCGGTYHPTGPTLITQVVAKKDRGTAMGLHLAGGSACFFVAPIFAGTIAATVGWRGAFLIVAVPTLLAGLLIWWFVRPGRVEAAVPAAAAPGDPTKRVSWRQILKIAGVFILLGMLAQIVSSSLMSFLTLYMVDKHGLQSSHAAMLLAVVYGAGLVAAPFSGMLSDRLGRAPVIIGSCLLTPLIVLALTATSFGALFIVVLCVMGISQTARPPVIESFLMDIVPASQRASIMGFYFFLSMETSSVMTPATGWLMDNLGADFTFRLLSFIVLGVTLAVVAVMLLRRRTPKAAPA